MRYCVNEIGDRVSFHHQQYILVEVLDARFLLFQSKSFLVFQKCFEEVHLSVGLYERCCHIYITFQLLLLSKKSFYSTFQDSQNYSFICEYR